MIRCRDGKLSPLLLTFWRLLGTKLDSRLSPKVRASLQRSLRKCNEELAESLPDGEGVESMRKSRSFGEMHAPAQGSLLQESNFVPRNALERYMTPSVVLRDRASWKCSMFAQAPAFDALLSARRLSTMIHRTTRSSRSDLRQQIVETMRAVSRS